MNMSRARGPKYSLEYLSFIAAKRKRRGVGMEEKEKDDGGSAKRPRMAVPPTVTETMREVWKEMREDGYCI